MINDKLLDPRTPEGLKKLAEVTNMDMDRDRVDPVVWRQYCNAVIESYLRYDGRVFWS